MFVNAEKWNGKKAGKCENKQLLRRMLRTLRIDKKTKVEIFRSADVTRWHIKTRLER